MDIINQEALIDCWKRHPASKKPLQNWFNITSSAEWRNVNEIKQVIPNVSVLSNNRVVFNIKGNDFRLVVIVKYTMQTVFIRWVGTHSEYDKIDANTI